MRPYVAPECISLPGFDVDISYAPDWTDIVVGILRVSSGGTQQCSNKQHNRKNFSHITSDLVWDWMRPSLNPRGAVRNVAPDKPPVKRFAQDNPSKLARVRTVSDLLPESENQKLFFPTISSQSNG